MYCYVETRVARKIRSQNTNRNDWSSQTGAILREAGGCMQNLIKIVSPYLSLFYTANPD